MSSQLKGYVYQHSGHRLHMRERCNDQMACFQPVRTKLFELPTTSASQ